MEEKSTEVELESFRQQWRKEVTDRTKGHSDGPAGVSKPGPSGPGRPRRKGPPPTASGRPSRQDDEHEPREFNDLEDKEIYLQLGNEANRSKAKSDSIEPRTALEHYEKAVERETQGSLGDSVNHYRKAFRLDARVQEVYKNKYFPPSSFPSKPSNANPSNAPVTVPNPAHHSLEEPKTNVLDLIEEFSTVSISPAEPETDLSEQPPCPVALIPEEVLADVLLSLALSDVASLGRLARVCKRFAYLVVTEERIWKRIALGREFGFAAMHYTFACDLRGHPFFNHTHLDAVEVTPSIYRDLTPSVWPSYRSQFRYRPRIRFNGCYISTVNYSRPGASHQSYYNWTSPVQIVTYYRYLRFFRDGTVISLLTTVEPSDVVHHLTKENIHDRHTGALPSAVMKDALRGRWRMSGSTAPDLASLREEDEVVKGPGEYMREPMQDYEEEEGDVHVETEGVIPKYMWKMQFAMGSAGRRDGTRNNKLSWKGFWSYNRLTDDWGEFGLKNDKAFYWSRVKSYDIGS